MESKNNFTDYLRIFTSLMVDIFTSNNNTYSIVICNKGKDTETVRLNPFSFSGP